MSHKVLLSGPTHTSQISWQEAAALIDHTLLAPDATRANVTRHCQEAAAYGFYSVMVNPTNVAQCASELRGSQVLVGTVIGFPLGATTTTAKLAEADDALRLGARELDMVINIGSLKSGDRELVRSEIHSLAKVCHSRGALLKVIIETSLLKTEEKILICQLSALAGVDMVKTSTGYTGEGATTDDVRLIRGVVGQEIGVKASGGIRCAADLIRMVEAGASRIGTSAGIEIVRELGAPDRL